MAEKYLNSNRHTPVGIKPIRWFKYELTSLSLHYTNGNMDDTVFQCDTTTLTRKATTTDSGYPAHHAGRQEYDTRY